ncbi:hypothetical protein Glove_264g12 [Diversispora epigaea]|uniref:Uncharacterized protein n=1 Tax=Diversispora epigaea TaxID=1348612 RepID=A0A397IAY1_9GLOM|nr:hypothetical protein Glove_264g12 [Diversispora epigaea]
METYSLILFYGITGLACTDHDQKFISYPCRHTLLTSEILHLQAIYAIRLLKPVNEPNFERELKELNDFNDLLK